MHVSVAVLRRDEAHIFRLNDGGPNRSALRWKWHQHPSQRRCKKTVLTPCAPKMRTPRAVMYTLQRMLMLEELEGLRDQHVRITTGTFDVGIGGLNSPVFRALLMLMNYFSTRTWMTVVDRRGLGRVRQNVLMMGWAGHGWICVLFSRSQFSVDSGL